MILLAKFISAVSNPFVISVPISFALVYRASANYYFSLQWTIISLLFTLVVGAFVYFGVRIGIFSDFDISKRAERPPIFIFTSFVGLLYLLTVILLNGPLILIVSSGGLMLGILLESIINRRIKASIHLAVYSALSIIIGILYGGLLWLALLLIPVVAWSRIKLKLHVLPETIVGSTLGISLVMIVYLVIQYFYN